MNNNSKSYDADKRAISGPHKGSITDGFFIGLIVMIVSSLVSWLTISIIAPSTARTAPSFNTFLMIAALCFPFASILCATIWCGWKGKEKTAIGIMASIAVGVVSLPILLIAACFGMFK